MTMMRERNAFLEPPGGSQLAAFRTLLENVADRDLRDPGDLHAFSVQEPEAFWRTFLEWSGLPWSGSAAPVLVGRDVETACFFPEVRLNYAEALLRPLPGVDDEAPALTSVHADRPDERLSRRELRAAVRRAATAFAGMGLSPGDRVVVVAPNNARAAVAVLGALALGATVSTSTPDMGPGALLGRLGPVEPALLLIDRTGAEDDAVDSLLSLPTLRRVLVLDDGELPVRDVPVQRFADAVSTAHGAQADWPRLPFNHPLFVMFSSGTTGPPKAMVHGAGGTLLEHVKEHRLHENLRADDTLYFHTTTAWMMWNWQLSALSIGAHIVLYDGPVTGPSTLWRLVAEHGVTVFGTSPAYLQLCQDADYVPCDDVDLSALRLVQSTGAVLHDWQFDWVSSAVGPLPLHSISGGTDIIGCFVLGHPDLSVRRGWSQTRSLGLDVAAVDPDGSEVVGAVGELVCRRPFPSRPVGFLHDPDGARFHASYFAQHPGMWTHGDEVEVSADGAVRVLGRSDGVLNIDGVRVGPSEIYSALRHAVPAVTDAMAIEQDDPGDAGRTRMVLLVVLRTGAELDGELDRSIRRTLRREASAAHVPALVLAVPELPVTHNGKPSEAAARAAANGRPVRNLQALRNPESVDHIRRATATAQRRAEGTTGGMGAGTSAPAQDGDEAAAVWPAVERIWCEVLGVRTAQPDDEFSDMGGTSRRMMQLLRKVLLEIGVDVQVARLGDRPTLSRIAAAVAEARAEDGGDTPVLRAGHGLPLFFLCDAWGQLNSPRGLVTAMTTDRPVRGLKAALVAEGERRRTITELADAAVVTLREVQPSGPYSLVGYSFGGLIAYEVAVRLRAAGEDVEFLGLIDVHPPTAVLTAAELAVHWLGRVLRRLRTLASRDAHVPLPRWLRRHRPAAVDLDQAMLNSSGAVCDAHTLSRYDGEVSYYLADERLPIAGNTLSAWRRVAPNFRVTHVPGNHFDMLHGAALPVLAADISAALADASRASAPRSRRRSRVA